jgi:signal transduction histidine kinase
LNHSGGWGAVTAPPRDAGLLVVEVSDDGSGRVERSNGSGLRGLTDRLEARGGRLIVESEPGSGTRVRGEIPCGS